MMVFKDEGETHASWSVIAHATTRRRQSPRQDFYFHTHTYPSTLLESTKLQLPRANAFNPARLFPNSSQILARVRRDEHHVLNANTADGLIACQNVVIDMFGSSYRLEEVLVEVDAWFDGLRKQRESELNGTVHRRE